MNPFALEEPLVLRDPYLGRMSDDEFFSFCQSNRALRVERDAQGGLWLAPPRSALVGKRSASLLGQLGQWQSRQEAAGILFNCHAGFTLANGAVRAPDASWVSAPRWNTLTPEQQEKFATVCPEFVVELRSKTDSMKVLLAKMEEYRQNGALLGWLLSCDDEKAYIFRAGHDDYETLAGFERELSGEVVLPGLRVDLRKLR